MKEGDVEDMVDMEDMEDMEVMDTATGKPDFLPHQV